MRASQFYFSTLKETPADTEVMSQQLMIRAGLIRRVAAGIYTWMPLGLRILRKVEAVVREEMEAIGAQECLMPMVQPGELWQETGRWQAYGPELLRLHDRHQRDFCLGPTHEEVITDLMRKELKSYKQLPLVLYQIQTKFRDEIRPRFGVIRAREFVMKDAYSFHSDPNCLDMTYQVMYKAYIRIFKRLGLIVKVIQATTGSIGGHTSHEFQALSNTGEDILLYDENSPYAVNQEFADEKASQQVETGALKSARGIEVGHIFQLGTKYSQKMQASIATQSGLEQVVEMGCYGIGISRIVATAIEQNHDAKGIQWPSAMAPFKVVIIPIGYHRAETVRKAADELYQKLQSLGWEPLIDDRSQRPGVSFSEMDLLGVPHRIVISEQSVSQGQVEYKSRKQSALQSIQVSDVVNFLAQR